MYRAQLATTESLHLKFQSGFICKLSKVSIGWTNSVQIISSIEYNVFVNTFELPEDCFFNILLTVHLNIFIS